MELGKPFLGGVEAKKIVAGKINMKEEAKEKPLTARVLSDALKPEAKPVGKVEEARTIVLTMVPGNRPEVKLEGFWNGRFIRSAMDSIAKAYRLRKYEGSRKRGEDKSVRPDIGGRKPEGGKGNV